MAMEDDVSLQQIGVATVIAATIGAITNAIIFAFASVFAGDNFQMISGDGGGELGDPDILPVIIFTFVGLTIGGGVLAILHQFTQQPRLYYVFIAGGVLLLSFVVPFLPSDPSLPDTTIAILIIMHVTAAVVGVWTTLRFAYGTFSLTSND
jgi:hypothetical protein